MKTMLEINFDKIGFLFSVFEDKKKRERAKIIVKVEESLKEESKEKNRNFFEGTYYVNNLLGFYTIISQAAYKFENLDRYKSLYRDGNDKNTTMVIRRIIPHISTVKTILKHLFDYKEQNEDKKKEEKDIIDEYIEKLFAGTNINSKTDIDSIDSKLVRQWLLPRANILEYALSRNIDQDFNELVSKKVFGNLKINDILNVLFPSNRILIEIMSQKDKLYRTAFTLDLAYVRQIKKYIEESLEKIEYRKKLVSLYPNKPEPSLLIEKREGKRYLSILPNLPEEVELPLDDYNLLREALSQYIETGYPGKAFGKNVSLFKTSNVYVLNINNKITFSLRGRRKALEILFSLL